MLKSCLPPTVYIDPDVFELERERLFCRLWIFAGLRAAPGPDRCAMTREIGGTSVTIIADANGSSVRAFAETPSATNCSTARDVHVKILGRLVFVNLSIDPIPLEEQFTSEFQAILIESSMYFDNSYIATTFQARYNWKLNFENVMDFNHLPFIHAKSFNKLLDTPRVAPSPTDFSEYFNWDIEEELYPPYLSDLSYASYGPLKPTNPWFLSHIRSFPKGVARACNWYVYPNVNYGCLEGKQFYIEQYMPLAPNITEYHLWILTAERLSKRFETTALLHSMIKSHKEIVNEDKVYLESLQSSLSPVSKHAVYGKHELPLYRAGRWYRDHILHGNGSPTV